MKNISNLGSRIIYELSKCNGLTNAELVRTIHNKNILPQNVNYYLKALVKSNILKKEGKKYILIKKTFLINGSAVVEFQNKLLILECPYFGNKCKRCNGNKQLNEKCLFIDKLPKSLKNLFENVISPTSN